METGQQGSVNQNQSSNQSSTVVVERKMHIRKDDMVIVVAGDSSGSTGRVLSVDRAAGKVVVEGINRVTKHVRRGHPKSPQGGRLQKELPVDISNVAHVCPQTQQATRVSVRINDDGSKDLVAKKSGAVIRTLSPASSNRAR
ncbi:MAG: ribosomal protein [Planctomycetota bacterium]